MERKAGVLLTKDALLQRNYFKEMVRLRGLSSQYQYPLSNKDYNLQGELTSNYSEPQEVWVILNENIDQKTSRKLGWNAELVSSMILISVPYDLENLQVGCLFTLPSAIDDGKDRLFRVAEMLTVQLYPASITCSVVPEYETEIESPLTKDFTVTNFNLLREG